MLWLLAGLMMVQFGIALAVDQWGQPIRDPEYDFLFRQLTARRAEAPGRPVVLALGSSRTQMGLRAGRLSETPEGPLVFNFAIPGSGPMMQQVVLRRLLDAGIRPDLLFVEAMPVALCRRGGAPLEERFLDPARLSLAEALRLHRYYHQPYKLWLRWLTARALPLYRHRAELCETLALNTPIASPHQTEQVDGHGWLAEAPLSPEQAARKTRYILGQYAKALGDFALGEGPAGAMGDLLEQCRRENLATVMVAPPESSAFRAAYRAGHTPVDAYLRRLSNRFDVPCFDARAWVGDAGFLDGHHLSTLGADQYTERFGREALAPLSCGLAGLRGR